MQVMRIAMFEKMPDVDPVKHDELRKWMATQPGFRALYHAVDPTTGRLTSVSVWDSREQLMAMKDRTFPGGPLGLKPDSVEIYDIEAAVFPPTG